MKVKDLCKWISMVEDEDKDIVVLIKLEGRDGINTEERYFNMKVRDYPRWIEIEILPEGMERLHYRAYYPLCEETP